MESGAWARPVRVHERVCAYVCVGLLCACVSVLSVSVCTYLCCVYAHICVYAHVSVSGCMSVHMFALCGLCV